MMEKLPEQQGPLRSSLSLFPLSSPSDRSSAQLQALSDFTRKYVLY